MRLLDVNVLLAMALEAHAHHVAVHRWLQVNQEMPIATCALTETSLLRLLMNPAINADPVDAQTGMELLGRLHRHPRHRFLEKLPDPCDPAVADLMLRVCGYRQVTDAYLVALARANGGKLATFDGKRAGVFGADVLEIIQPGKIGGETGKNPFKPEEA